MNCRAVGLAILLLLRAVIVLGQASTSVPSKDEIFELLNKADEKVASFQDAIKQVKPDLDMANSELSKRYLDAASTSRQMIRAIKNNGVSAYRLVGLLATLDDLSVDAATASVTLLLAKSGPRDSTVVNQVVLLMTCKNACNDIAELIMHATLRFILAEEDLLEKTLKGQQ